MDYQQLLKTCDFSLATPEKIVSCESFTCGEDKDAQDLNEFFSKDAIRYHNHLLGKTYFFCLKSNPQKIVTALLWLMKGLS